MKIIINFAQMSYSSKTSNLMNYDFQGSNSANYGSDNETSLPMSFPRLMENGIIIKYENLKFSTELIDENIEKVVVEQ